jgi:hypothetical protein
LTRPAFSAVLFLFLIFTACENLNNPVVSGVTVSPQTDTLAKGGQRKFTAVVEGTGGPSQEVTWSVEGNNDSGTAIDVNGLLTVAAEENAAALTVRATSKANTSKSGIASVTITETTNPGDQENPGNQENPEYLVFIGDQSYSTLEAAIDAAAGTTAAITLMSGITVSSTITVSFPNSNITLTGGETERVISTGVSFDGLYLFSLEAGSGISFTLDKGVTLQGGGVKVNSGAALVLKDGAKITGSGNHGVAVDSGDFRMEGGSIEGEVYLRSDAAIDKTGGTISSVYVDCTDNPVRLENVEDDLTKATTDTTESSLTGEDGWTR